MEQKPAGVSGLIAAVVGHRMQHGVPPKVIAMSADVFCGFRKADPFMKNLWRDPAGCWMFQDTQIAQIEGQNLLMLLVDLAEAKAAGTCNT